MNSLQNHYLQYPLTLEKGEVVEVALDHAANVQLLDEDNFQNYQQGKPFRYRGGYAQKSPVQLDAPGPGKWHLVIDLGGGPGSVRAGVKVYPASMI